MPYVSESIIVQQNEKLVGLVYPDFDEAFAHGLKNEDIERVMEENRVTLNAMLPAYSQILKMKIYPEEFEKDSEEEYQTLSVSGSERIKKCGNKGMYSVNLN